ncbi:hypothetical protein PHYSODRAFT_352612 [Phytophthora sojae]|uniref:CoA carboxyltransferase N-terminal domain-containing protein n=1 Tax=Phytophthora sojae (strain P6497) TaxID=1094619 RepID=G5A381_PHYSP|nr:hypothetical protein PHYSODRAFT_352612 [Phytophthora sojae]EGZ10121.1 hypothetical protein PHYSODRAFT_352612 [Phytophthora sojae]|eukprot:XP_009534982.1 hypothetical protein PHYSODRAFT_352612 [Phytophthora sojae]
METRELIRDTTGKSLTETTRPRGQNDIGMVAWLLALYTPEFPDGRAIIIIANDITFKAGSFGTREDTLFDLASKLARSKGIPRFFFSANAGARIGMAEPIKALYKVCWEDETNPTKGFDTGEERYGLNDIVGRVIGLGVECLRGSGTIAGKTSRIPGRVHADVYTSNDQLGGVKIMHTNGVTHLTATNHLLGIYSILEWLAFVPMVRRGQLPIRDLTGVDEIERTVDFGCKATGKWVSGLMDKDSFRETLDGWAKSVIVGRGRLGDIPCRVVVTEVRTSEKVIPADPAAPASQENLMPQTGQVWFPDSAHKTATAVEDFKGEDLPLFILANWRGFSGRQRDMIDELPKLGAAIVDGLGRGGLLEPAGLIATARNSRLDDMLEQLTARAELSPEKKESKSAKMAADIKTCEETLLPIHVQMAMAFDDLHDSPDRMKSIDRIRQVVPWPKSGKFFCWRLKRQLPELTLHRHAASAGGSRPTVFLCSSGRMATQTCWLSSDTEWIASCVAKLHQEQMASRCEACRSW